jgi:hypothetical protein
MNSADGLSPEDFAAACSADGGAVDPVADMWIQFMGIGGNGWPQLGGRTVVDGLAAVGQQLNIPGFALPAGPTQVPLPPAVDGRIRDMWGQLRGTTGNGWPQLGGRTLVDGLAAVGKELKVAGFG